MLREGRTAPAFELPGVTGGRIDEHALDEYTDNGWTVVVVFYPFDFHPSCTETRCTLRNADWLTLLEETVVLGISTDSVYSHRAFADEYGIDAPLLSDGDGRVAEAYGVLVEEIEGHGQVARSSVFAIDPDRTVQYAWQSETATDEPDLQAVRRATQCHGDRCTLPEDTSSPR